MRKSKSKSHKSRGMTIIELLTATVVMTAGALGVLMLSLVAVAGNSRNKLNTSATGIAHTVLEQIQAKSSKPAGGSTFVIGDCRAAEAGGPQSWTVETASAAAPGAGAAINLGTGAVDFTQSYAAVPFNYKMRFVGCGAAGRQVTYDVRWNVRNVSEATRLVTVSVRPLGAEGSNRLPLYAPPVTMRGYLSY